MNTWKIREPLTFGLYDIRGSTPLEREDVIFMIVKMSSLRNKSDEEVGVKVRGQKSE